MRNFRAAMWSEVLKVRRSKIFWITILAFSFITLVLALMMFILKNPELARNAGLLGAKAQIIGEANWTSYFDILAQIIAMGGLIGFGFVNSWIFGREFSDRTANNLLALPTSRSVVVLAKFVVMLFWCILLALIVFAEGIFAGKIINLAGWSGQIFFLGVNKLTITSIFTIVVSTPVAFFASFGRGFLPPMGFVVGTMAISQFAAALGHGRYFPWAIPALYSGAAGPEQATLEVTGIIIVLMTGIIGLLATLLWWRFADQS